MVSERAGHVDAIALRLDDSEEAVQIVAAEALGNIGEHQRSALAWRQNTATKPAVRVHWEKIMFLPEDLAENPNGGP